MQKIDISNLIDENNCLIKDVPIDKIIVGKIDKLYIQYKYKNLNLSKIKCNEICYYNQEGESIKNHKLPNLLKKLYCDQNKLTYLPELPNSLKIIYCDQNKLTYLPKLPNSLQELNCSDNELTSLPNLPNSLRELYCHYNQLISLSNLPKSLEELMCSDNQLTSLPKLPNSLERLNCSDNKLMSLPNLPILLKIFYIGNINLDKIEYSPDYKNVKFNMIDSKIIIGNYIIKSKEDYISYMEDYEKHLLSKVKSARK